MPVNDIEDLSRFGHPAALLDEVVGHLVERGEPFVRDQGFDGEVAVGEIEFALILGQDPCRLGEDLFWHHPMLESTKIRRSVHRAGRRDQSLCAGDAANT